MNAAKTIAITGAVLIGVTAIGASVIFAAQVPNGSNRMNALVTAIAQKFHLNQSDVQQVFDDQRQQWQQQAQAQRDQRVKANLDQAVKDGKLTQAQEDLIIAKEQEVKTFMASLQGKTATDRQAAVKTEMDSLKTWEQANNIPAQYLLPFGGGMHRFGGIRGWGRGMGMGRGMMGGWATK